MQVIFSSAKRVYGSSNECLHAPSHSPVQTRFCHSQEGRAASSLVYGSSKECHHHAPSPLTCANEVSPQPGGPCSKSSSPCDRECPSPRTKHRCSGISSCPRSIAPVDRHPAPLSFSAWSSSSWPVPTGKQYHQLDIV